ncbi:MAG: DNA polymerase III subunit alpha, partial [Candidatus Dormibacteraceae bacterium]
CTVEGGAVRIGLGYVQGLGEVGGRVVVETREQAGDFASLFDFVQRTGLTGRAVENLIKIGGFDAFHLGRRDLLWQQGLLPGGGRSVQAAASGRPRQLQLGLPTGRDQVHLQDFSAFDRVAADYEILRLSPTDHPMSFQRAHLRLEGVRSAEELHQLAPGARVSTAGLVVCRQQPLTANGIIFLLLEDETGLSNLLVPRRLCEQDRERVLIRSMPFLRVGGRLEGHAGAVPMLVCERIDELELYGRQEPLQMPAGKSWG